MIKVFDHWFHLKTLSRIALDAVVPIICVISFVLLGDTGNQANLQSGAIYAVIFALAMVVVNSWLGLYRRPYQRTIHQTRARAVLSLYLSIPLAYAILSPLSVSHGSKKMLLISGLAALAGTLVHRVFTMHRQPGDALARRILIFGAGPEAKSVGAEIEESDPDAFILGFYPSPTDVETTIPAKLLLSRSRSLTDTAMSLGADEIIVAVRERRGGVLPLRELLDCKLSGVSVVDVATYFERKLGQIRLDSLRAGWLIFGDGFRQSAWRSFVKRVFDIVAASVLLLLAVPVMAATALAIILEDGFPLFYRQDRVGLNGRIFKVIKFRSMRKDAESDGKPKWAAANDSRVTRVGRIIRRLRIDELPQLFTVLAGEMSLVGPRPERPYFVDQLTRDIPFYEVRHSVKPGLTGWAQVSYHYGASVDDSIHKLQYDLYYVKNHTLFLDMVILFETVGVVLTGKGAQ